MKPDFQSRSAPRRIATFDTVVWILAILALCVAGQQVWTKTVGLRRARASLNTLRASVQAEEARLGKIRHNSAQMDVLLAGRIILTEDAPPEQVLVALERVLPAGARFDSIALDYGESLDVSLQVVARRPAIFDEFLRRLESSPDFTNVVFGAEGREGEMRVSVSATYRGSAMS
jgi:Tfp pilus assembly protein PilN